MQLTLSNPALERFVDEQVKTGSFPNHDAVVESALARMMEEEVTLDADDAAAFEESDRQIENGESIDFSAFAAEMRNKYNAK